MSPLERTVADFVNMNLRDYELPKEFHKVAVDVFDDGYGRQECTITSLFEKPFKLDDSDRMHFIMNKIKRDVNDYFGNVFSHIAFGSSTVDNYNDTRDWYTKRKNKKLNESDESKQEKKFKKLLNTIEEHLNSNSYDSVVRFMVDYDEVMDDVIVNIFFDAEHAVKLGGGINRVIKSTGKKIMEDLSVFPFDFKYHIHFERQQLNESEDDEEKKIQKNLTVLRKLISMFDYSEVCDMWVEYDYEDGDYIIRSKMSTKNHNTAALEKEFEFLEGSIESFGFTNCYVFRPYYVENCENELNESENKKKSLFKNISDVGLYDFIKMTSIELMVLQTQIGQIPREMLEQFIKDYISNEGHQYSSVKPDEKIVSIDVIVGGNAIIDFMYYDGKLLSFEVTEYAKGFSKEETDQYIEGAKNYEYETIFKIVNKITRKITN